MQIIRFQFANEAPAWGWVNENMVGLISGSPFGEYRRQSASIPMEKIYLLAPATPSKILGVGRNYAAHAQEQNVEVPEIPLIFLNRHLQSLVRKIKSNYPRNPSRWNMRPNLRW